MESIIYQRLNLQLGRKRYLLYVGEIKTYGLALYMAKTIEKYRKVPYGVIFIIPDVMESYPDDMENVIVINPYVYDTFLRNLDVGICKRIAARIPLSEFYRSVSRSRFVLDLIIELLKYQNDLFVYIYEAKNELDFPSLQGLRLLNTPAIVAERWNDKFYQYEKLNSVVPVPEFCMVNKVSRKLLDALFSEWGTVFATGRYSAAGSNSAVLMKEDDFYNVFGEIKDVFMFSRYIPHRVDPTVLGIIANERDVFIVGVADQIIEKGNRFAGSVFPSSLPPETVKRLREYARRVGVVLAQDGFRGFFGCDFIVDDEENIYFVEVNARKQGTTMEFCCTYEVELGPEAVSLTDLEYSAIVHNSFPIGTDELYKVNFVENPVINWGTYNYKTDVNVILDGSLEREMDEWDLFKKGHGYIVTDYIGDKFTVRRGTFIARVIAVGDTRSEVLSEIKSGKEKIDSCIKRIAGGVRDGT